MSLSDYSSDEDWEDEEAIVPEAIKDVGRKMKENNPSSTNATSSVAVYAPHCLLLF